MQAGTTHSAATRAEISASLSRQPPRGPRPPKPAPTIAAALPPVARPAWFDEPLGALLAGGYRNQGPVR